MSQQLLIPEPDPQPQTGTARFKVELVCRPHRPRFFNISRRWRYEVSTIRDEDGSTDWGGDLVPRVRTASHPFKWSAKLGIHRAIRSLKKVIAQQNGVDEDKQSWYV